MRYAWLALLLVLTACGNLSPANVESNQEALDRYLATNDVEPRIAEAMRDEQVVEGMTEEQLRLVVGASVVFDEVPEVERIEQTGHEVRRYPNPVGEHGPLVVQLDEDGKVVMVQDPR